MYIFTNIVIQMKSKILIFILLIGATINLFAQKAKDFTVNLKNAFPFGIFEERSGKETNLDLLQVHFEFVLNGKEYFFVDALTYSLIKDFKEFSFDSISAINENLLLKNKHFNLSKIVNKCKEPHVIIETKSGHLFKFIAAPYKNYFGSFIYDVKAAYYVNEEILLANQKDVNYYNDTVEYDYYFYKKYLPKIGTDSIVRFHFIQSANSFFKNNGLKAKIYTSNWVNYPAENNKKYYDKIDTTIEGMGNLIYNCYYYDSLQRNCFLGLTLFNYSKFLNFDYINSFERIDSSYIDDSLSYYKTKNYIFKHTYLKTFTSDSSRTCKILKSSSVKCLNDTLSENIFNGIYTNDLMYKVIKRLENSGYKTAKNQNSEYVFYKTNNDKSFIHLKGKNEKLNEVLVEYK